MKIDFFNHIRPADYTRYILSILPELKPQIPNLDGVAGVYDIEVRKKVMEKWAIDMQVLTLAHPAPDSIALDSKEAVQACRIANRAICEVCERDQDMFVGIASLPMNQPQEALDVMKTALNDFGMKGIQLSSHILGKPLDSEEFLPVFEMAARMDVPVLIHPIHPSSYIGREYEKGYDLTGAFGWPFETSLAVSRLILSGLLERYSELKIVTHHLGGIIPYSVGRVQCRHGWPGFAEKHGWKISKPPLNYYKMIYADTAVCDNRAAMRLGYEFFGADRIVFGSDYPFGPEKGEAHICQAIDVVEQEAIPEEDRKKIFEANARRLVRV